MAVSQAAGRVADTARDVEQALAAIEAEFAVVFGRQDRVAEACAVLRRHPCLWTTAASDGCDRLTRLLRSRSGPLVRPLADLLSTTAATADDPWPLLEGLLSASDPLVVSAALDELAARVDRGALEIGPGEADRLAAAAPIPGAGPARDAALGQWGRVLRHLRRPSAAADDPVLWVYLGEGSEALRRIAAQVLDLAGIPPPAQVAIRVLGEQSAEKLGSYLAYTRASYVDLLDLALPGGTACALVQSMARAERVADQELLREVIAELGWRRVSLGLDVRPVVGVSVSGSLPFLLTPAEAVSVEACRGARRAFESLLIIAHGGSAGRDDSGVGLQGPIDRFRTYNLAHAEVLADMLDAGPLTPARVHAILTRMDGIVTDFVALFRDRTEDASVAERVYADLKARVLAEVKTAAQGASLSPEVTRLVLMFEDPRSAAEVRTLHGLKRYLHQRGLTLGFGLLEAGRGTNRTVDLVIASARRVIHVARGIDYVDFEALPTPAPPGERIPYPVSVVVEAFAQQLLHGETSLPTVKVFCYGNEVHYFVAFRNHPAFVRIDFSPPLGGGMIDLQYYGVSKYDLDTHPRMSLDGIRAMFERLDFDVEVETTRIHARYDKERALTLADLCDHAEMLFRLSPYFMDLDWVIGQLAMDEEARRRVEIGWADLFARWGTLPLSQLLTTDRLGIIVGQEAVAEGTAIRVWSGTGSYVDRFTGRPSGAFLVDLRAELSRRRLTGFMLTEREEEAAQIPLLRRVLRPLRRAVARGEIVEDPAGLHPAPAACFERLHEAEVLARLLGGDDEPLARAARLAHLAASLERTVQFATTGTINGYEVQRAWLELRDETIGLYVLRDRANMIRLAVFGPEGTLSRRRGGPDEPWGQTVSDDIGWLTTHLRRSNFLPSWIDSTDERTGDVASIRQSFATPNPGTGRRPPGGEHAIEGLRASPGRAVGPARLGLEGRDPSHVQGGVLVVPSLRPADCPFLFSVAGVVCTGGSILSHAGLLAVEFGRPALIVRGRWEKAGDGQTRFVYACIEFDEVERRVGDFLIVERCHAREHDAVLSEGDLLALDADEATLRVLGQGPAAIALHDGLSQLAQANARLSRASSEADALVERGRRLRALHQLERLFTRLADPVLVHHALRELLLSGQAGDAVAGQRDKARLVRVLLESPACGATARDAVTRVSGSLAERFDTAAAEARRRIPLATDPSEILGLRLSVARLHAAVKAVRALLPAFEHDPVGPAASVAGEIETTTARCLEIQRAACRAQVRSALAAGRPIADARHLLDTVERLDDAMGATADNLQWREAIAGALAERDRQEVEKLAARWVIETADGGIELEPLVGWKTAFLAEAARLGFAALVPPWFVVSDRAFREMLDGPAPVAEGRGFEPGGTLRDAIRRVLASTEATAEQKAERIKRLWLAVELPREIAAAVQAAYRRLSAAADVDVALLPTGVQAAQGQAFVAVRSSAHQEDTDAAAHAGEFDTFLFVQGDASLFEHLKRAWSGLWTERAIRNRSALGLGDGMEGGGVLVQRMVWSRVAGVLQTTNVAEGIPYELVMNVGLGLGEGVVSGLVAADHVVVSKEERPAAGRLRFRYATAEKRERVVFDARAGRGTLRAPTLSHQRLRPALEYVELVELAQIAVDLEAAFRQALDVEFAYEGAHLRLLQVRRVPAWRALWWETAVRYPLAPGSAAAGPAPRTAPIGGEPS